MAKSSLDRHFQAFRTSGDVAALAEVFDEVAPEMLRVARHLAPPSLEAQDLVQNTFLVAIQRAGAYDPDRPVKQWLLGILAKEAAYERRRAARVVEPDRLDEPPARDPSTSAGDQEFSRALDRALEELPPKYREVVRPVLIEGMNPREVARAVGQRPGTVRVQLHRGLRLLRDALPAGFALGALVATRSPGMAAVRAKVLLSGTGHPQLALAGSSGAGVLLATARTRTLAAGLALAVAVGGGLWLGRSGAGAPTAALVEIPRSDATTDVNELALGGRELVRAPAAPTGTLPTPTPGPSTVQVGGRVLGLDMQPSAGAEVELDLPGAGRFRTRTDGAGDFSLPVVLGASGTWSGAVRASDGRHADVRGLVLRVPRREAHLGTLMLGDARPLEVRVLDPEGRGRAGAEVEVRLAGRTPPGGGEDVCAARLTTGPEGRARAAAVPFGPLEVLAREGSLSGSTSARGRARRSPVLVRLATTEGEPEPDRPSAPSLPAGDQGAPDVLLRLASPAGPVWNPGRDALTAPVALSARPNNDGELELEVHGVEPGQSFLLTVEAPGFRPATRSVRLREPGLPNPVDVQLEPLTSLALEVARAPGLAVELELQRFDAGIGVFGPSGRDWGGLTTANTSGGAFRFDGLLPGTYRVRERLSDLCTAPVEVREGDALVRARLDLEVLRRVQGRVVVPDPELLPQTCVVVDAEGLSDQPNRWMPRQRYQWTLRPDADGRFSLMVPCDRPVRLQAYHPLLVQVGAPVDPFSPFASGASGASNPSGPAGEIVLELRAGNQLTLALHRLAEQHELDRVRVLLYEDEPEGEPRARLYPRVEEGLARFAGVPPGTWTLFVDPGPRTGVAPAVLRGVTVRADRTLELSEPAFEAGGTVALDPLGASLPRMGLFARSHGEPEYVRTASIEAGEVPALRGLGPGSFTIWAQSPSAPGPLLRAEVELGPGGLVTLTVPLD